MQAFVGRDFGVGQWCQRVPWASGLDINSACQNADMWSVGWRKGWVRVEKRPELVSLLKSISTSQFLNRSLLEARRGRLGMSDPDVEGYLVHLDNTCSKKSVCEVLGWERVGWPCHQDTVSLCNCRGNSACFVICPTLPLCVSFWDGQDGQMGLKAWGSVKPMVCSTCLKIVYPTWILIGTLLKQLLVALLSVLPLQFGT